MFGKVIGAVVGGKVAQRTKNIGGPAGAAIGVASTMILRRLSFPAMAALAVGGYAYKRFVADKEVERELPPRPPSVDPIVPVTPTVA